MLKNKTNKIKILIGHVLFFQINTFLNYIASENLKKIYQTTKYLFHN